MVSYKNNVYKNKVKCEHEMELAFDAKSENENFARVVIAAFCTRVDPTIEEIADVKTTPFR